MVMMAVVEAELGGVVVVVGVYHQPRRSCLQLRGWGRLFPRNSCFSFALPPQPVLVPPPAVVMVEATAGGDGGGNSGGDGGVTTTAHQPPQQRRTSAIERVQQELTNILHQAGLLSDMVSCCDAAVQAQPCDQGEGSWPDHPLVAELSTT